MTKASTFSLSSWATALVVVVVLGIWSAARIEATEPNALRRGPGEVDRPKRTNRIINGDTVEDLRYPYFSLMLGGAMCGGVLIAPQLVLGAAHCDGAADHFRVGAYDDYRDGHHVMIRSTIKHPKFDKNRFDNDVMIFKLEETADYPYITLEKDVIRQGEFTVVGFGNTNTVNKPELPGKLQEVELEYVDNDTCDKGHGGRGEVMEDMMCVAGDDKGACNGDSGGPLIKKGDSIDEDRLVGLVSWGRECAQEGTPGVSVRISFFYDWIIETVCDNFPEDSPPYMECTTPDVTSAPTKEPCSITEIVCDNPDFNYFCASLTATGIAEKFDDYSGNYTVFAPNNSAFEHLGDAAIEYLMQPDNVDLLSKILAFHTVEDQIIYSNDLTCQETIKMANGKDSRSICRKQNLYQNGKGNSVEHRPEVVEVDIETCNGVIHVVNQVMLFDYPEELGIPLKDAMVAPTRAVASPTLPPSVAPTVSLARNPVSCKTIDRLVCENPDFSILCDNLNRTGLSNDLTTGTWTLFAPNNEAFLKLPPNYIKTIDKDDIIQLLLFHAVAKQALYKDDLPCIAGQNLIEMANGKNSRTLCDDNRPGVPVPKYQKGTYNQRGETAPEFVTFDMNACNGVVHKLDAVLLFKQIEE